MRKIWVALLAAAPLVYCQQSLTLEQAVNDAIVKYPATRVSLEQVAAAASGINLARTSYLPRVDFIGQVNRATRNNIFGLMMPQTLPVISSISGPVLGTNNMTNVWGSAIGVLVSWEPFDFGLRKANVAAAEASKQRAQTAVDRTKYEVGAAAADAYLTLLAARQTVKAAQAGVERARVLSELVAANVKAELRPGADLSRTKAELALAQNQVIQAEQAVDVTKAALAQLLGVTPAQIDVQSGPYLGLPAAATAESNIAQHPVAIEQNAVTEEVKAREKALDRAYFPKFTLQGTSYARGTGALTNGETLGGANGLGPNYQNWALGMTVTFSAMDLPSIRARREIEQHRQLSEAARYDQLLQDLNGRVERAKAALNGARRLAENMPAQLEASRAVELQATARYKAGLGTLVEVAEAERLLTQAEIDDSLAKLNVWRAMLGLAAAQGDLGPFLAAGK
jgi:outer membrane protein TolC